MRACTDGLQILTDPQDGFGPLPLLVPAFGYQKYVRSGSIEPRARVMAFDVWHWTNRYICLSQNGDGNFRVLASDTVEDCENNIGELLFHTGVSIPDFDADGYVTQIQNDGNLITRHLPSGQYVWKTCSKIPGVAERMRFVLNPDYSVAMLNEASDVLWSSASDEGCYFDRPLVWMRHPPKVINGEFTLGGLFTSNPIKKRDRLTKSYVCLFQQGDCNLRVVCGDNCRNNQGALLFHSGYSVEPNNYQIYLSQIQDDGNLVTYKLPSREPVWLTCSATTLGEYMVAITHYDSVAIMAENGDIIWDSASDDSCFV